MDIPDKYKDEFEQTEKDQVAFRDWLDEIRDIDNQTFEHAGGAYLPAMKLIRDSDKKQSLLALQSLMLGLGYIKNGVIEECEQDNLYSASILYRSYLEHWLKSQYVWVRLGKDKSDQVGEEYLELCALNEEARYGNSLKVSRVTQ